MKLASESVLIKLKKIVLNLLNHKKLPTEKFGNKDGMLKSFLIPMCFWITKKINNKKPYIVLV